MPEKLAFITLKVKDADHPYRQLQEQGVEFGESPRDIPWGATFLFRFPDEHLLRIFSSPENSPQPA